MVQKDSKIEIYTCSYGYIAKQEQVSMNDYYDQPYIHMMLEFGTITYKCPSFISLSTISDFKKMKS